MESEGPAAPVPAASSPGCGLEKLPRMGDSESGRSWGQASPSRPPPVRRSQGHEPNLLLRSPSEPVNVGELFTNGESIRHGNLCLIPTASVAVARSPLIL